MEMIYKQLFKQITKDRIFLLLLLLLTTLAYNFLLALTTLSGFVFVMFFYRFFRANKKQIGCIKALGFKNNILQSFFVTFTVVLSLMGAFLGLLGGYFLSDVLLGANAKTYEMTGLTKGIGFVSFLAGMIAPTAVFGVTAYLCYGFVRNKEAGALLAGNSGQKRFSLTLKVADKISRIASENSRLSLRIALRKPLAVLLLFTAVMAFQVCVILGQSVI